MTSKSPHFKPLSAGDAPSSNGHWTADLGNGRYRNPILFADYSDPDVIRQGDDFYMTASSFQCTPGLPILHSKDLVNWRLVNHAITNLPHARYWDVQPGCGVWAPSLRFHEGRFWIVFAMPDEGIYVTTAADPLGKWTEPHLMQEGKGLIDPCPFWDDDGNAYLVHAFAHSRCGIKHQLRICPMAWDGSRLLDSGTMIYCNEQKHPIIEGPKFLKRDGYYYILAPAGGVATGWQTALRSRHIYGPYEDRVVLEQGSTTVNGPHQGALVDTPNGKWWFIHFQDAGVYGRITHLQPVEWRDDWPEIGIDLDGNGIGEPVAEHAKPVSTSRYDEASPQTSDDFDDAALGLQWQWNANHHDDWCSSTQRPGWARLFAHPLPADNLALAPNLLLQKISVPDFCVDTLVELSAAANDLEAGLVVMGHEYASLAIQFQDGNYNLIYRTPGKVLILDRLHSATVKLRMTFSRDAKCEFAYAAKNDDFVVAPQEFQAVAGNWIGARIGLYAVGLPAACNYADFDYFKFDAIPLEGNVDRDALRPAFNFDRPSSNGLPARKVRS